MKTTTMAILAVALYAMAAMPTASAAAHGVAWTATGVATGADGATTIIVHFHSQFNFLCPPGYTVTVKDALGNVLEQRSFNGFETQNQLPSQNVFQEMFVSSGASSDPAVSFSWYGVQWATIGSAIVHQMSQAIAGTFQGREFSAVTVSGPIDFGAC